MLNAELAGIDNGVVPWQKTWMAHEPADTICDAVALLDVGLRVKFANEPFYRTLSLSPENTLGKPFYELGTCQEGSSPVRSLLERILRSTNGFEGVDVTYTFSPKDERVMRVRACRMQTHAS